MPTLSSNTILVVTTFTVAVGTVVVCFVVVAAVIAVCFVVVMLSSNLVDSSECGESAVS